MKGILWILWTPAILGQLCMDAAVGQGPSAATSASPGERLAEYVGRLDANRNGLLEPGEVPVRVHSMLERTAEEAGLDRSRPWPVDRLAEALKLRFGRPAAPGLTLGVPPSESPPPAAADGEGERFSRYATLLLRKYDANGDGLLQQVEWAVMPGNPRSLDSDGDSLVTAEELADRLNSARSRRPVAAPVAPAQPASSAPVRTSAGHARTVISWKESPTYAPPRHLPEGLPDWFMEKDTNGDGQVMMHEYADHWTESRAREFETYDPDGDGIITAKECLRAEEEKPQ